MCLCSPATPPPHTHRKKVFLESSDIAFQAYFDKYSIVLIIKMHRKIGLKLHFRPILTNKKPDLEIDCRCADENLARLMRIAIKGPELEFVAFEAILDIFKQSNRRITL